MFHEMIRIKPRFGIRVFAPQPPGKPGERSAGIHRRISRKNPWKNLRNTFWSNFCRRCWEIFWRNSWSIIGKKIWRNTWRKVWLYTWTILWGTSRRISWELALGISQKMPERIIKYMGLCLKESMKNSLNTFWKS